MGHNLKALPSHKVEAYKDMDTQCTKCGAVFRIEISGEVANFLLDCELEKSLREQDPEQAKERPILVEE